jgi:hypothetical protein
MLPQRRKSAEEIAKLRESMGVPGPAAAAEAATEPAVAAEDPADRGDRIDGVDPDDGGKEVKRGALVEPVPPAVPKPVRSLRKSERKVVERVPSKPAVDSAGIPIRRRTDDELMEMRRIQATPPDQSIAHIQQMAVPWPVIALGYLLPLFGALCAWFAVWSPGVPAMDFPAEWIGDLSRQPWLAKAGLGALGLFGGLAFALAGWIAWKKPRSRHHAGFIGLVTLLVLVFGILQLTSTHGP